jgi:hypothetical protein
MARHYRIGGGPMLWARKVAASTAPISRLWGDIVGQDSCQPAVDAVLLSLGRHDDTLWRAFYTDQSTIGSAFTARLPYGPRPGR